MPPTDVAENPIRVLVAKVGLDGHDRGVKVVARALRDAGMEVIYTGLHRTPEQVIASAVQEDVDAIGVSLLSGAHMTLLPRLLDLMRQRGVDDKVLIAGGVMPDEDVAALKGMGVADILGQDTPPATIVARRNFFRENTALGKSQFPVFDRLFWNCETRDGYLAGSPSPAARTRPGEKGNCGSGPSGRAGSRGGSTD